MSESRDEHSAAGRSRHLPALDGLRGIAFLLVALHNFDAFEGSIPAEWILAVISHMGWIGVQVFFVLSGFLITDQLVDGFGKNRFLRSFFLRRAFRILPLYYLAVISLIVIAPRLFALPQEMLDSFPQQTWLWLLVNNWTQPFNGPVIPFSHFWSLAVEEQFYLIWPFVVLACLAASTGTRRMLQVCMLLVVVALAARCIAVAMGLPQDVPYMFTICRMDALAVGAATNILYRTQRQRLFQGSLPTVILAVAFVFFIGGAFVTNAYYAPNVMTNVVGYPILAFFTAVLIFVCAEERGQLLPDATRGILCLAPLRSMGKYSYAMYIVHLPLLFFAGPGLREAFANWGPASNFAFFLVLLLLTYVAGMLSFWLIERHLFALRDRVAPRVA